MVTPLEIGLLILVLVVVFGTYRIVKAVKPLVVNAVVGLVVLLIAEFLGFGVAISPVVVLIVAFGGLPAALLVILLAYLGILFQPAMVAWALDALVALP